MPVRTFNRTSSSRTLNSRAVSGLAVVSLAAALGGCVSHGNTHALITPAGVVGYHSFKPDHTNSPRDIQLPEQRTPDLAVRR